MSSYQPCPTFEDILWYFDSAATGPRPEDYTPRWRAWVKSSRGEPAELVAYERDARWYLCLPHRQYPAVAEGKELSLEAAQRRVFNVWMAMTREDV